jgi:hypothetical protein
VVNLLLNFFRTRQHGGLGTTFLVGLRQSPLPLRSHASCCRKTGPYDFVPQGRLKECRKHLADYFRNPAMESAGEAGENSGVIHV